MGALEFRRIQSTGRLDLPTMVREVNNRLEKHASIVTANFRASCPRVELSVAGNGTYPMWMPLESYEVESISVRCTSGTGTVQVAVGGVNITFVGGASVAVTTTATTTLVSGTQRIAALDDVDLVVSGLTASSLIAGLKVRRIG